MLAVRMVESDTGFKARGRLGNLDILNFLGRRFEFFSLFRSDSASVFGHVVPSIMLETHPIYIKLDRKTSGQIEVEKCL